MWGVLFQFVRGGGGGVGVHWLKVMVSWLIVKVWWLKVMVSWLIVKVWWLKVGVRRLIVDNVASCGSVVPHQVGI